MNNCSFTGRLIKDIEIRKLKGNKGDFSAGSFTLAVGTQRKEEGSKYYEDQLVNFSIIGNSADFAAQYFKKGDVMEISNAEYVTRKSEKDGRTMYFHEFRIKDNGIGFPARATRKDNDSSSGGSYSQGSSSTNSNNQQDSDPFRGGNSMDLTDDDLPF